MALESPVFLFGAMPAVHSSSSPLAAAHLRYRLARYAERLGETRDIITEPVTGAAC